MINDVLLMNGYGLYVWSAFVFTLLSFASLYVIIKMFSPISGAHFNPAVSVAFYQNKNIRISIKKNSYNIYLKVSIEILKKRLQKSNKRPLLDKNDIKKTLINLMETREKFYKKADLIIKNEKNMDGLIFKEHRVGLKIKENSFINIHGDI